MIEAATIVTAAFEGLPPPPYAIAYVRLDNVSTAMLNFVRGLDFARRAGGGEASSARRAGQGDFADSREGRVTDFHYELV